MPERRLENAICDASGDQAGSIWKKSRAGADERVALARREPVLRAAVGVHLEDRVVAVPRTHEREIRPCLVGSTAARSDDRRDDRDEHASEAPDRHRARMRS